MPTDDTSNTDSPSPVAGVDGIDFGTRPRPVASKSAPKPITVEILVPRTISVPGVPDTISMTAEGSDPFEVPVSSLSPDHLSKIADLWREALFAAAGKEDQPRAIEWREAPPVKPIDTAPSSQHLKADEVTWVVNQDAEVGVEIRGNFFFCMQGTTMIYDAKSSSAIPRVRPLFDTDLPDTLKLPVKGPIGQYPSLDGGTWKDFQDYVAWKAGRALAKVFSGTNGK